MKNYLQTKATHTAAHEEKGGKASANPMQLLIKPSVNSNANAPVQGFLLEGLALTALAGLAGYGGYRFFRHRQRENTLTDLENEQQQQLGAQVITHTNDGVGAPTSLTQAANGAAPQAARNYNININDDDPVGLGRSDASLIRTAEFHEKTHAVADKTYSANAAASTLYLEHGNPANPAVFGPLQIAQWQFRDARVQRLKGIVQQDNALTDQQKNEIDNRLTNAEQSIEYDPTINELLMYTREYGIRANSETVKALVLLARENQARRGPGGGNMVGNWPV